MPKTEENPHTSSRLRMLFLVRPVVPRRLLVSLLLLVLSHHWVWIASSFQSPIRGVKLSPTLSSATRRSLIRLVDDEYGVYQDGKVEIAREPSSVFQLYYRIYNPLGEQTPLFIVHGGPSLPSQYLYPLVNMVSVNRPLIFYDQLGCGGSDEPKDLSFYSIALSILDMNAVVNHTLSKIALSRASEGTSASPALEASRTTLDHQIHLFGHSYGGSLAYEYVKFQQHAQAVDSEPVQSRNPMSPSSSQTVCRSLILCNAIQNMKRANDDYDRLYEENPKGFWTQHACREGIPPPLQDALNHLGTAWNGMTSVLDYVATPIPKSSSHPPSTLLLWGGRDFGLRASHDKVWKSLLDGGELEVVQFKDCAHYPFYEDKEEFARVLEGYLKRMDAR